MRFNLYSKVSLSGFGEGGRSTSLASFLCHFFNRLGFLNNLILFYLDE
jgi:hypothetical protein